MVPGSDLFIVCLFYETVAALQMGDPYDHIADLVLHDKVGEVLSKLN